MKRYNTPILLALVVLLSTILSHAKTNNSVEQQIIEMIEGAVENSLADALIKADTTQLRTVLKWSEKEDFVLGSILANKYLGKYYYNMENDVLSALAHFQTGLELFSNLKSPELHLERSLKTSTGHCYFILGRWKEAEQMYIALQGDIDQVIAEETDEKGEKNKFVIEQNLNWVNIGNVLMKQGREEEGYQALRKAYDLTTRNLYEHDAVYLDDKMTTVFTLSFAYLVRGEGQLAKPYLEEYHSYILQNSEVPKDHATSYGNLAYCAFLLEDFDAAYAYYDQSLAISIKHGYADVSYVTYKDLSDTYLADGNMHQAIRYLNKHYVLKDSLQGINVQESLNSLKVEHETVLKEQEIIRLNQQNQLQRQKMLLYTSGLLVVGLISLFIIGYLLLKNKQRKEKAELSAQQQKLKLTNAQQELEYKTQDITRMALEISKKHDFAEQLLGQLNSFERHIQATAQKDWRSFEHKIRDHLQITEEQQVFKENIEQINQAFYTSLSAEFPSLSVKEKDFCSYLRLGLSNKEISVLRGVTTDAVRMRRHRLRKKLNLDSKQDVEEFLQTL